MKTYVLVLPALLLGCGFYTRPSGTDQRTFDADEIAALSDGGRRQSQGDEGDAESVEPDMADAAIDAAEEGKPDGGHIGADDGGHLEPDATSPEVDGGVPQAGSAAPAPDAAVDASVDAGTPEQPRGVCFECQTDEGCETSALCYKGFCMPRELSSCKDVCGGVLPKEATTFWAAVGATAIVCIPDDGTATIAQSCLNFFAAGHSCD